MSLNKRIIVLCDGTWQDGKDSAPSNYTNIYRMARALNKIDNRTSPPIHQIALYLPGVATNETSIDALIDGASGGGLQLKVEEAYSFIQQNWVQGDQICLFGFSRGSYTARMVAGIIGEIGILDRNQMEHFGDIFLTLQKKKVSKALSVDPENITETSSQRLDLCIAAAKNQVKNLGYTFLIKCVGVFETVGSMGLPDEIHKKSPDGVSPFGFSSTDLGEHVGIALHALALNETREDFLPTKWTQTEAGRKTGQLLKQVWFAGSHSDVGGGWSSHDSSDLSLAWMISSVSGILSFDEIFVQNIPKPSSIWGHQVPNNPRIGYFRLSDIGIRTPPSAFNTGSLITNETYHSSVINQSNLPIEIVTALKNQGMIEPLLKLESIIKANWNFHPILGKSIPTADITFQSPPPVQIQAVETKQDPIKKMFGGISDAIKGIKL